MTTPKQKHSELLEGKFSETTESLLYNSGGSIYWSLFRFSDDTVAIYYHDEDYSMPILQQRSKYMELKEIAESWNPDKDEFQGTIYSYK